MSPGELFEFITFIKNATHDEVESAFIQLATKYPNDTLNAIRGNTYESEVADMIRAGYHKIAVIKAYRLRTKTSLREAKDFVEYVADKHDLKFGNYGQYDFSPTDTSLSVLLRVHNMNRF